MPLRDDRVIVLGLPRGGVVVAAEVAEALGAPLDVIVVRKLGVPFREELAMGAVGEGGVLVANDEVIRAARVTEQEWSAVVQAQRRELERRTRTFRGGRGHLAIADRTVVLVDDGIATGSTALAACRVARAMRPRHLVFAVPVAPSSAPDTLSLVADEVVCLDLPRTFHAVTEWYNDFFPTSDDEVVALLDQAARRCDAQD